MFVFEGFIVGLVGSLHCIGMCGPLVLALPLSNQSTGQRILGGLLYNVGRSVTYAILGLIFGIIGKGLSLVGIQQWISIIFGGLLILAALLPGLINLAPVISRITPGTDGLKSRMRSLLQQKKIYPLFLFGLLNGLLPCGLVYMAIMGAIINDSVANSILYMFLFGMGTLPVMFLLIYFSSLIKSKILSKIRKVIPVFIIILGILFILRGMNLGIKYISPKLKKDSTEMQSMPHH